MDLRFTAVQEQIDPYSIAAAGQYFWTIEKCMDIHLIRVLHELAKADKKSKMIFHSFSLL